MQTPFDLSNYGLDIVGDGNEAYVPLQTMHDILLARNYYFTVYNGEEVFVFAYGCSLFDQIESVPTAQMSESYAEFNYNELVFMLDHFYGLKPEHYIDGFYKFILDTGLIDKLASADPDEFDRGVAELALRFLDDQHSGFLAYSYRSEARDQDPEEVQAELDALTGVSRSDTDKTRDLFEQNRAKYYPGLSEEPFTYEEVGDTAIITFDSFFVSKQDYYKDADLKNPQDTIELIAAAHKQITRKGSPVKNVVLDLSHNGGGNADAAAFVIAWYGGAGRLGLRDTITGAQSVVSYVADVNLDGKYDDDDTLSTKMRAGELNLYCLTSSNSFSCGNLVPAAFKGSGVVLIGQATGGGSCIVLPCTTASGTLFRISGSNQISTIKNGSFYNADTGIEPDVPITKLETYYDREQLVEFIHSIK